MMPPALKPLPLTRTTLNGEVDRRPGAAAKSLARCAGKGKKECAPHNPSPPPPTPYASPSTPPFTPASLHFTLGFLYTGTLIFSHRTYLSTSLTLLLFASYLALPTLYAEVSACIITEMGHAASTSPPTRRSPAAHGAQAAAPARKCAGRVPRILEFALRDEVKDAAVERGSRRALVGWFGTGVVHAGIFRLEMTRARWVCGHLERPPMADKKICK
ncbi:hypothetical protein R3P38DRAFT_3570839 [Favolaschia claudopus]|uniref:Uncharacterized protein n=1 Tax=Favolaschia claudopus TaxID=2862362 RepID=A0AAW0ASC7_9AGAR